MKKAIIFIAVFILLCGAAYAGFLSGNTAPYVEGKGSYAFKLNTSILMAGTPFSSICLSGKYGFDDNIGLSAKFGIGTVDYTTVSGVKLSVDPQINNIGFEYLFMGTKKGEYYAFVAEAENVSWSINRKSNMSSEILMGVDYSNSAANAIRTRYRLAVHNFNAGPESEEKIATSVKYSLSTELEYSFTKSFKGCFEAGVYFGDPVGGVITLFGVGLGLNF